MFTYITLSILFIYTYAQNLTMTENANLMISSLPLLYARDELGECEGAQNVTSFNDCKPFIKDPVGSCCFVPQVQSCIAVPTDSPLLYKSLLKKQGFDIDCPLVSNATGEYKDEFTSSVITFDEAKKIMDSIANLKGLTPDDGQKCVSVEDPTKADQCVSAFSNNDAKCCLFKGDNGSVQINYCNFVPNATNDLFDKLYGSAKITISCS
jgi:hypothetical protein